MVLQRAIANLEFYIQQRIVVYETTMYQLIYFFEECFDW